MNPVQTRTRWTLDSSTRSSGQKPFELPADVTADDDVASEDGAGAHFLVDRVRNDTGSHRELDGARVDDADDVAGPGGLEDAEEWPVTTVLRVQLDDLIVVPEYWPRKSI